MTKREILLLPFCLSPLLLTSLIIYFRFFLIENPDRIIQKKENLEILLAASKLLRKIWHEGDFREQLKNKKLNCSEEFKDLGKVDSSFFRCNKEFLECVIRESLEKKIIGYPEKIKIIKQKHNHFVKTVNRLNFSGPRVPAYGVLVRMEYNGDSLPIILEDSCNQTVLPQRIYSYGSENVDWRWDTFNRLIVLDKNMVTNLDLTVWQPHLFSIKNSLPAIGLNSAQMEEFCSSKGMQLLQAHIFDAATFLPGILKNPEKIFKSPYPGTRIKMNFFLFSAQRYDDFIFNKKFCNEVYSSECLKTSPFSEFQFKAATWLGLSSILGGPMEYMRNPITSQENLFVSSFHFPIASQYHQLGKRSYWDGEGFTWDHFKLSEKPVKDTGEVGFRCMRVISNGY